MKYTIRSSKYVLKNFLYVFPFAVIPAFFLSGCVDEVALNRVLEIFFSGDLHAWNFPDLFRSVSVLNFASWRAIGFGLFGVVALIVCVALMMAVLEKHMRIGKRTFNGIFSKLNDNLVSTSGYALLLLAIYEIWSLVTAALLFFVSRIDAQILSYVFVGLVFLGMHFVLLYAVSLIYLWLPCMQITGFRAKEALYYSNQLSAPIKWQIVMGQMVFLLAFEAVVCLCAWFAISKLWFTVLTTALYCIMIMIYCARMQIAYFDLDNIDRADLNKYYRR